MGKESPGREAWTLKRILALVEGQTEETFINRLLYHHLLPFGLHITPVLIATKRVKSGLKFKGGVSSYQQVKGELRRLFQDSHAIAITTMLDYYGLPKDFPGTAELSHLNSAYERVEHLEQSLQVALGEHRFLPYLSLHEFEALLLASPREIAGVFSAPALAKKFEAMVASYPSPEEVTDGPETHPAARIERLVPQFQKRLHGPLIAQREGLESIRSQCPHFDKWLSRLESLN